MWVLGTEPRTPSRTTDALSHGTILPVKTLLFIIGSSSHRSSVCTWEGVRRWRTHFRSWFSPSTEGPGDWPQVGRLVWQGLSPCEPAYQPYLNTLKGEQSWAQPGVQSLCIFYFLWAVVNGALSSWTPSNSFCLFQDFISNQKPRVLLRVTIAVMQSSLDNKGFFLACPLNRNSKQSMNLEAGNETEAVEKYCLLVCSSWLAHPVSYRSQNCQPWGSLTHRELCSPTSILNFKNSLWAYLQPNFFQSKI